MRIMLSVVVTLKCLQPSSREHSWSHAYKQKCSSIRLLVCYILFSVTSWCCLTIKFVIIFIPLYTHVSFVIDFLYRLRLYAMQKTRPTLRQRGTFWSVWRCVIVNKCVPHHYSLAVFKILFTKYESKHICMSNNTFYILRRTQFVAPANCTLTHI